METTDGIYLYGASGHAKVISDIIEAEGKTVHGFIDDNPSLSQFRGLEVRHSADGCNPIIVSIGNCNIRRKIVDALSSHDFATAIHPAAVVSPSARIGIGSVVMPGAIVNAEASIGRHCIVNTKASVDHDCRLADFVHIAPGCTVCGGVEVGEATWVGTGTSVKQGVKIGKNCMIGAGSTVVSDIPDNVVAFGTPARVIRKNLHDE